MKNSILRCIYPFLVFSCFTSIHASLDSIKPSKSYEIGKIGRDIGHLFANQNSVPLLAPFPLWMASDCDSSLIVDDFDSHQIFSSLSFPSLNKDGSTEVQLDSLTLRLSPDGTLVAYHSVEGNLDGLMLRNLETRETWLETSDGKFLPTSNIQLSSSSTFNAFDWEFGGNSFFQVQDSKEIRIYKLPERRRVYQYAFPKERYSSDLGSFTYDQKQFILPPTIGDDNKITLQFLNTKNWSELTVLAPPIVGRSVEVFASPSNAHLVLKVDDQFNLYKYTIGPTTIELNRLQTWELVTDLPFNVRHFQIAFSPDLLFITDLHDVFVHQLSTNKTIQRFETTPEVQKANEKYIFEVSGSKKAGWVAFEQRIGRPPDTTSELLVANLKKRKLVKLTAIVGDVEYFQFNVSETGLIVFTRRGNTRKTYWIPLDTLQF